MLQEIYRFSHKSNDEFCILTTLKPFLKHFVTVSIGTITKEIRQRLSDKYRCDANTSQGFPVSKLRSSNATDSIVSKACLNAQ